MQDDDEIIVIALLASYFFMVRYALDLSSNACMGRATCWGALGQTFAVGPLLTPNDNPLLIVYVQISTPVLK